MDNRGPVPRTHTDERWHSAPHAERHGDRRGDLARRSIPRLGRIDRWHAGASRASDRRGSQHRARATGAGRLLGNCVLVRRIAGVLCDQERAGTGWTSLCRQCAWQHSARTRGRHRQHHHILAGWTSVRVLSRQFPGARIVIAACRQRREWDPSRAGSDASAGVLRAGVLCCAVVVTRWRTHSRGDSRREDGRCRPGHGPCRVGKDRSISGAVQGRDVHGMAA